MNAMFTYSVVGGTFDRFHKGHRALLDAAFSQSKNVLIGITTEKLYKMKRYTSVIDNYMTREEYIREYIQSKNLGERVTIVPIDTIYGTTLEQEDIDAIFVTDDNKESANLINKGRSERGYPLLQIITVPLVKGEDGQSISSERIRKGEIDRDGITYSLLFQNRSLVLPHQLRDELRKPIGRIFKDISTIMLQRQNAPVTIAVGDIVSLALAKAGNKADVSIIDFKTRRHTLEKSKKDMLRYFTPHDFICANQAGMIEMHASEVIRTALAKFMDSGSRQIIHVTGEEDLLTLPAILFAPLNSLVIYGQYDEGAVLVEVTEQRKQEVAALVKQFTSK